MIYYTDTNALIRIKHIKYTFTDFDDWYTFTDFTECVGQKNPKNKNTDIIEKT